MCTKWEGTHILCLPPDLCVHRWRPFAYCTQYIAEHGKCMYANSTMINSSTQYNCRKFQTGASHGSVQLFLILPRWNARVSNTMGYRRISCLMLWYVIIIISSFVYVNIPSRSLWYSWSTILASGIELLYHNLMYYNIICQNSYEQLRCDRQTTLWSSKLTSIYGALFVYSR